MSNTDDITSENLAFEHGSDINAATGNPAAQTTALKVEKANVGGINRSTYKVVGGDHDGWWAKSDGTNPIGQNEVTALRKVTFFAANSIKLTNHCPL
jgi:hypothetical protein